MKTRANAKERKSRGAMAVRALPRHTHTCLSARPPPPPSKPPQLVRGIDYATFLGNPRRLLDACRAAGMFLWLDMESAGFTGDTLRADRELLRAPPPGGGC